jgi:hypothetical protein
MRPLRVPPPLVLLALAAVTAGVWLGGLPAAAQPAPTSPPLSTSRPAGPPSTTTRLPGAPPSTVGLPPALAPPASPGVFDVAGRIREAVNGWVRELVAWAIGPTVELAAQSVLATPDLTAPQGRVTELWRRSAALANAGYVLLVAAGGVLVMTNETLQARYTIKEVAPRLVVGIIASNISLLLVGFGIQLANALARALLSPGVDPEQARATLKAVLIPPLDNASPLLLLVGLAVVVLAVVLAASYVLRVALLVVLIVAGPLALACHGLPQTEELARWWWRATTACLMVPVAQALAVSCGLQVFFHTDTDRVLGLGGGRLVDLLVAVCLLWLLARIPVWAARLVLAGRPGTVMAVAKSYVTYRLVRRGLSRLTP